MTKASQNVIFADTTPPAAVYAETWADLAPDLDPVALENLALDVGSTLNGMPREFFVDIVKLARQHPELLAA